MGTDFFDELKTSSVTSGTSVLAVLGYCFYYWWKHRSIERYPLETIDIFKSLISVPMNVFRSPSVTPFILLSFFLVVNSWILTPQFKDPAKVCVSSQIELSDLWKDQYRLLTHIFFMTPTFNFWSETIPHLGSLFFASHFLQRCQGFGKAILSSLIALPLSFFVSRLAEPLACLYGPSNWISMIIGMVFVVNHKVPFPKEWLTIQHSNGTEEEIATRNIPKYSESRWLPLSLFLLSLPTKLTMWWSEILCGLIGGVFSSFFLRSDDSLVDFFVSVFWNKKGHLLSAIGGIAVWLGVFAFPLTAARPPLELSSLLSYDWWHAFFTPSRTLADIVLGETSTYFYFLHSLLKFVPLAILGGLAHRKTPIRLGLIVVFTLTILGLRSSAGFSWKSFGPGLSSIIAGTALSLVSTAQEINVRTIK